VARGEAEEEEDTVMESLSEGEALGEGVGEGERLFETDGDPDLLDRKSVV
jgi:hypothetical protein